MTLLALAAPVGACVTRGGHESDPLPPPGYNFAYLAEHREEIGLIQAFDDGEHTFLQFKDRSSYLVIRAGDASVPILYRADKRYVSLDGVYDRLLLSDDQATATLVNEVVHTTPAALASDSYPLKSPSTEPQGVADSASALSDSLAAIGVPEAAQTMHPNLRVGELNREIASLEDRIQTLTEQLAAARQNGESLNLSLRSDFTLPRVVVHFDDNSAEVQLDLKLAESLGAAARAANRIYLHGHTDAYVASSAGTELAIKRAVAVRKILIAHEVSPDRVRLFYRGAGNFLANNSTPDGKALNRRVEIELRKW